jgi:MoaA/NifB/PqqE/SkfB family radical SAM enzyme
MNQGLRNNIYSDLKIVEFPAKLASFREGKITAPIYVRVKPINKCNHACRWCVYKADRRPDAVQSPNSKVQSAMEVMASDMHLDMVEQDVMPRAKMIEVLDDFQTMGVKAVTYSGGGEPLLHANSVEFMEHTLKCGIDLSIITNGQLLSGDRAAALAYAKWVRVSMDYTTGAQMARTRVVPERLFDQVLENLQTFARLKRPGCDLGVNFIVHRDNCGASRDGEVLCPSNKPLVAFAERLKDLGVENVRFSPMYVPGFVEYHAPIREWVEKQLKECQNFTGPTFSVNTTYDLHNPAHSPERGYTRCFFMQTVPVVGADQNVYACHNKAFDKKGLIGSIREQRFAELWFSEAARAVFETLNPQCDCRHQCANDSKNRHIMNLVNAARDNFV